MEVSTEVPTRSQAANSKSAEAKPEWFTKQREAASDSDKTLFDSSYAKIHDQNHFLKGEGPHQALTRLKKEGILPELSIDDINKESHRRVKQDLGPNGDKKRNHYTTSDQVLSPEQEKERVLRIVEEQRKHNQAERVAPSTDQIKAALKPEIAASLKAAGLPEVQPEKLRAAIVGRIESDAALTSADLQKMKGFPVGAPYVAMGAVSGAQMDSVIAEQRALRASKQTDTELTALKTSNPEEYKKAWGLYLGATDVGALLKRHSLEDPKNFNPDKIAAANTLIIELQSLQRVPAPPKTEVKPPNAAAA